MRSVRAFMFLCVAAALVCVLNVWMNSSEAPKVSMLLSPTLLTLLVVSFPSPCSSSSYTSPQASHRSAHDLPSSCLCSSCYYFCCFCCCCYVLITLPKTIGLFALSLTTPLTHCQLGLYYTSNPLTTHNNNNNNKNSE